MRRRRSTWMGMNKKGISQRGKWKRNGKKGAGRGEEGKEVE